MSGGTAAVTAIVAVAGAAMSAYGQIQQGQAAQQQAKFQSRMAAYNAQIAGQNAQMAEEEGREAKKTAAENAAKKRQEAAQIIGAQRAAFGASGAQVDQGAALDLTLDTTEKGELDALAMIEQGNREDYGKRVDAWNYRAQGAGQQLQSGMYKSQGSRNTAWLSAGGTLLGGMSQAGSNYYTMTKGSLDPTPDVNRGPYVNGRRGH